MEKAGISDISIYIPQYCLPHALLANARGIPKEKFQIGLGNHNMSIIPNYEDTVTMAANAAKQFLEKSNTDPDEIRQLVVSTESGVDHSKPVASFVQGLLDIGTQCRVFEIKHACYGGTAGLVSSIDKVTCMNSSEYKALVIMTDIAKYGFGSPGEPTQGAGAVALLVDKKSGLFEVDTSTSGLYSKNVFDFWRPTGHRVPVVDGKYSIDCYLGALESSAACLRENLGLKKGELLDTVDYFVYHLPYCTMSKKAHRRLIEVENEDMAAEALENVFQHTYKEKVVPGLLGAKEVGNIYTGSVYMSLISLLESERSRISGKKVGLFSYGSGCGAEFMVFKVKKNIQQIIENIKFLEQINRRKELTFEQYTQFYSKSSEEINYYPAEVSQYKDSFTKFVFTGFKNHKRNYI